MQTSRKAKFRLLQGGLTTLAGLVLFVVSSISSGTSDEAKAAVIACNVVGRVLILVGVVWLAIGFVPFAVTKVRVWRRHK